MAKEFKTIEELVEILRSRGIATDSNTASIIQRESYFAIISGYKAPFLDRKKMTSSSDDVYIEGTSFNDIYELFLFDRRLRQTTLPFLLSAESVLKNAVVYAFCSRNRGHDAYLERSNYVDARHMLVPRAYQGNKFEEHATNLANLMKILNGKLTNQKKMRPFVRHYLESYGTVPLWVLQNDLTFGNIAHFFQLQKRGVQNETCKIVSDITKRDVRLNPHKLLRAFDVLVGFRNICAHDERLYCARVKGANYLEMFLRLSYVLPQVETDEMIQVISSLLQVSKGHVSIKSLSHVATEMGIHVNGDSTEEGQIIQLLVH